jgi:hypothetical protein
MQRYGYMRILAAVLGVLSVSLPLHSATLERLSLDDMISKSTAIVRGRVTSSHAAFHGSDIYTHYSFAVSKCWKGCGSSPVDVVVPGGTANGQRLVYSGVPQLNGDHEYVLFLWTNRSGLTYVIGFEQGVFELSSDTSAQTIAVRRPSAEPMLDPSSRRLVRDTRLQMSFGELANRIRSGLASSPPGSNHAGNSRQ